MCRLLNSTALRSRESRNEGFPAIIHAPENMTECKTWRSQTRQLMFLALGVKRMAFFPAGIFGSQEDARRLPSRQRPLVTGGMLILTSALARTHSTMATFQANSLRHPGRAHRDPCCREGDGRRVKSVGEPASRQAEVAQTALASLNRFSHAAGVGSRDPCAGPRTAGEGRSPGLDCPCHWMPAVPAGARHHFREG